MKDENFTIETEKVEKIPAGEEPKKETVKSITLKKPVEYNGVKYEKFEFDFDKLTGKDLLNMGAELRAQGKLSVAPIASSDFLALLAVRACTADIGIDIYPALSLYDAVIIENIARNFMLGVE